MTPNDFLKIIQDSIHKRYESVPKGWYSSQDLCKLWNCCLTATLKKVQAGIEIGIIEKKDYFLPRKNKAMHKTPHYYFHEKKNYKKENQPILMENKIRKCR